MYETNMGELLTEAITALCKSTLSYRREFHVEGLIGITLDSEQILLVNLNNVIRKDSAASDIAPVAKPNRKFYFNTVEPALSHRHAL